MAYDGIVSSAGVQRLHATASTARITWEKLAREQKPQLSDRNYETHTHITRSYVSSGVRDRKKTKCHHLVEKPHSAFLRDRVVTNSNARCVLRKRETQASAVPPVTHSSNDSRGQRRADDVHCSSVRSVYLAKQPRTKNMLVYAAFLTHTCIRAEQHIFALELWV